LGKLKLAYLSPFMLIKNEMGRRTLFEIHNQPGYLKQMICMLVLLYAAPAFATDVDSILAGKQMPAGIRQ